MRKYATEEIALGDQFATAPHTSEIDPDEQAVAALAHRLWSERGHPHGSPEVDWFRAEEILRGR